jgi:hypothetical protein
LIDHDGKLNPESACYERQAGVVPDSILTLVIAKQEHIAKGCHFCLVELPYLVS